MPRALLSVSDKRGIVAFAQDLHKRGWTLCSTGGTARALREGGLPVMEVSEITGHAEMMEGRVKTLHPAVHAGLLARRDNPGDLRQMEEQEYETIDLLVVNLYPFEQTIARPDATVEEAIENIDIGGPAMLRSAAKNYESVWVVVDPADYEYVTAALDEPHADSIPLRRSLAAKVFAHTSTYDMAIGAYLSGLLDRERVPTAEGGAADSFPDQLTLVLQKAQDLRYGENPDQAAAFYGERTTRTTGLPATQQLQGKALSFNNLLDVDGAVLAISAWKAADVAACAIIKHTTPCGLAVGADAVDAYRKALSTDPTSAFGSVVAFNVEVSDDAAAALRPNFIEVVVAPSFSPGARALLAEKKNLRLIVSPNIDEAPDELDFKRVRGGFLVQRRMEMQFPERDWRMVTSRPPTSTEWQDLRFAWRAVAAVKSNAILLARDGMTLGIGAGQMSRVDASRLAVLKATENGFALEGATLASDAFFPFRDGVDTAAKAGIRAMIQPGGSVRDGEVIAAADEHGVAMVFTGRRLFRH